MVARAQATMEAVEATGGAISAYCAVAMVAVVAEVVEAVVAAEAAAIPNWRMSLASCQSLRRSDQHCSRWNTAGSSWRHHTKTARWTWRRTPRGSCTSPRAWRSLTWPPRGAAAGGRRRPFESDAPRRTTRHNRATRRARAVRILWNRPSDVPIHCRLARSHVRAPHDAASTICLGTQLRLHVEWNRGNGLHCISRRAATYR